MVAQGNDRHDIVTRGQAIYERSIRAKVEPEHLGEFADIDVNSGEYETGGDKMAALDRLTGRLPQAVPCIIRVGHSTAVTFSAGSRGLTNA